MDLRERPVYIQMLGKVQARKEALPSEELRREPETLTGAGARCLLVKRSGCYMHRAPGPVGT